MNEVSIRKVENGFVVGAKNCGDSDGLYVFEERDHYGGGECEVEYIITMLYSVLDLLEVTSVKSSAHNVCIGCEEGKWVEDPPLCPNREDYHERKYGEEVT